MVLKHPDVVLVMNYIYRAYPVISYAGYVYLRLICGHTLWLTPGLYYTNASGSSNLVLNFIFEHVSMVSEQKTTKLILCHCTNILVLNLVLFLWYLIQKWITDIIYDVTNERKSLNTFLGELPTKIHRRKFHMHYLYIVSSGETQNWNIITKNCDFMTFGRQSPIQHL